MTSTQAVRFVLKPVAFAAALIPAALLAKDIVGGTLGANPVEALTHRTGFAALLMLTITLAVTPLRRITRVGALVLMRRMLGLFAFFYAALHLLVYGLDRSIFEGVGLSPAVIAEDIGKRPYITVGFTVFLILLALAVTSTKGWIRRLGGRRWQALHRLVYVAAIGGVVHFWWLVKADLYWPIVFAVALTVLLGYRVAAAARRRARSRSAG